jgi:uncharacterized protein YndB with AHSA1/START domain
MADSTFVYVTYIRTTPERVWQALTDLEFLRRYWVGRYQETEWKPGAPWRLMQPDGTVTDSGEILESDPPRRLAIRWRNELRPELAAEGYSLCTMEVEPADGGAKLTLTHTMPREGSRLIEAVSGGWPVILSNLKSLLETGEPVFNEWPVCAR